MEMFNYRPSIEPGVLLGYWPDSVCQSWADLGKTAVW